MNLILIELNSIKEGDSVDFSQISFSQIQSKPDPTFVNDPLGNSLECKKWLHPNFNYKKKIIYIHHFGLEIFIFEKFLINEIFCLSIMKILVLWGIFFLAG